MILTVSRPGPDRAYERMLIEFDAAALVPRPRPEASMARSQSGPNPGPRTACGTTPLPAFAIRPAAPLRAAMPPPGAASSGAALPAGARSSCPPAMSCRRPRRWQAIADGRGDHDRLTWLGHASFLLRLDGRTILTDPYLSAHASPLPPLGPKRFAPPGLPGGASAADRSPAAVPQPLRPSGPADDRGAGCQGADPGSRAAWAGQVLHARAATRGCTSSTGTRS